MIIKLLVLAVVLAVLVCESDAGAYRSRPRSRCQVVRSWCGRRCPSGSSCRRGRCCRHGPPPPIGCRHGSLGTCSGGQRCLQGYSCRGGKCCRNSVNTPTCPFNSDGICGGIAGLRCRPGTICFDSEIRPPIPDGSGPCCRTTLGCQHGSLGTCSGGQRCLPGYTCRGGKCCRNSATTKTCPFNSDGICGGIGAFRCRPGTICFDSERWPPIPDGSGPCCRTTTPIRCQHGSLGKCNASGNWRCLPGYKCRRNKFGTEGKCCRKSASTPACPFSSDGACGTIAGLSCPTGTICFDNEIRPPIADGGGPCCHTRRRRG